MVLLLHLAGRISVWSIGISITEWERFIVTIGRRIVDSESHETK